MVILWCLFFLSAVNAGPAANLTAIVIDGQLGIENEQSVNSTSEVIFLFSNVTQINAKSPARISVTSNEASHDSPVLVVVRQQRGVLSWQLPYATDRGSYNSVSRTLCPASLFKSDKEVQENLIVSVSTSNHINVAFTVLVEVESKFELKIDDERNATVSPSQPRFFSFEFPEKVNTILLEADSPDTTCMTISLQERNCPVYDLEGTVMFEGSWQTMTKKGGITLSREKFPDGFFIVLVVHGDDYACLTNTPFESNTRQKSVVLSVRKKISYDEYLVATFGAFGVFGAFYCVAFVVAVLHQMSRRRQRDAATNNLQTECLLEGLEGENETVADPKSREEKLRRKVNAGEPVFVSDMSRSGSTELRRSAQKYLWNILTVATFYGLPVIQLVVTYQRVLNNTGNQDLCFYNFLCSHPVSVLSDFNHVFSNVGYGLLGLLFVMLVYRRERRHLKAVALDPARDTMLGLPQQFGLFYALGAALIAEGVLSACYHVCPNQQNFQFDTSFMYVIAMMCMLRIYQNRHPDIHASAYTTFAMLAFVILIGMIGVLTGTIIFWSLFTSVHMTLCLLLSAQVYYMGCWNLDLGIPARFWASYTQPGLSLKARFMPLYPKRMALLIIGILVNVGLSVVGLMFRPKNFASYLLAIFMANLNIYVWFYIIMKLVHRERISFPSLFHILASFVLWGLSLFYFFHKNISWQETPALSRTYNHPCDLLDFYDYHDIWHFLSAASMFFSFMVLLTLDDDLRLVPRTQISVF